MTNSILWYLFHPNFSESNGNRTLLKAVDKVDGVTLVHAYDEYPDFKIDVPKEQDRLRNADLVVFQHPFYWYSCPPLFKKWQDDVLEYGFAYPPKEGNQLHGKHWLSVITTGGPNIAYQSGGYNNYSMSELLKPFQQTANLIGMRYHPPFIVNGVLPVDLEGIKATSTDRIEQAADELAEYINSLELNRRRGIEPLLPTQFLAAIDRTPANA